MGRCWLAALYRDGRGGESRPDLALAEYRKIEMDPKGDLDNPLETECLWRIPLALLLEEGQGGMRDLTEAARLFRESIQLEKKQSDMEDILKGNSDATIDRADAKRLHQEGMRANDARYHLGHLYLNGDGVPTDVIEACALLTEGGEEAVALSKEACADLTSGQLAEVKRRREGLRSGPKERAAGQ
jgi:TPR repeat protein